MLNKLFTDSEIQYSVNKIGSAQHLGARFAAKCAFFQAVKWIGKRDYSSIEIKKDIFGAPYFSFDTELQSYINQLNIHKINLTMTHIKEYSIANVILE